MSERWTEAGIISAAVMLGAHDIAGWSSAEEDLTHDLPSLRRVFTT
jgi:hypothetical protein